MSSDEESLSRAESLALAGELIRWGLRSSSLTSLLPILTPTWINAEYLRVLGRKSPSGPSPSDMSVTLSPQLRMHATLFALHCRAQPEQWPIVKRITAAYRLYITTVCIPFEGQFRPPLTIERAVMFAKLALFTPHGKTAIQACRGCGTPTLINTASEVEGLFRCAYCTDGMYCGRKKPAASRFRQ